MSVPNQHTFHAGLAARLGTRKVRDRKKRYGAFIFYLKGVGRKLGILKSHKQAPVTALRRLAFFWGGDAMLSEVCPKLEHVSFFISQGVRAGARCLSLYLSLSRTHTLTLSLSLFSLSLPFSLSLYGAFAIV